MDKPMRVIDVPHTATAEESEHLLNQVYADGYYLVTLTPHMMGLRGIFRQRVRAVKAEGADAAVELLKAHPEMSCRQAAQMLADHGFKHKKDWVNQQRQALARAS